MNALVTLLRRGALVAGLLALAAPLAHAQTDLLGQLEQQAKQDEPTQLVEATFKGTRLINGHTVQTPGEGTMIFLISHRFGALNSGAYNFFGLDEATLRLGFEYGITDRLEVGIGRSNVEKAFDGFIKYKAVQQSTGTHAVPFTLTLLGTTAINTIRYADGLGRSVGDRTSYAYQALLARKFSPDFSLQLMPTLVHRNMIISDYGEKNDIYALGIGGRYKLTRRFSLNGEYYYRLSGFNKNRYYNSVALGVDIETGGHVFQLHVTNSRGMIEPQFIAQSVGNVWDGDLFFGFNMSRNFTIKQRHRK